MHRDYHVNPAPPEKKDPEMEEVANCFAANFLVPEAALRDSLNKTAGQKSIGLEDVIFLKHHFKVSAQHCYGAYVTAGLWAQKTMMTFLQR